MLTLKIVILIGCVYARALYKTVLTTSHCLVQELYIRHRFVLLVDTEFLSLPKAVSSTHHIVKGKAVPLQAWSGPEGSRKLRFPYFITMALEGGNVVSPTHRPHLPPGNSPGTHFC